MRGILRVAAAAGLLAAFGVQGLHGQAAIVVGVGAGPIFPTKGESSFGPEVKSIGYHFQGIIGISPAKGIVSGRVDAQYASVNYETIGSDTPKDKIFGVNGDIVIHPGNKQTLVLHRVPIHLHQGPQLHPGHSGRPDQHRAAVQEVAGPTFGQVPRPGVQAPPVGGVCS